MPALTVHGELDTIAGLPSLAACHHVGMPLLMRRVLMVLLPEPRYKIRDCQVTLNVIVKSL